MPHVVEQFVDIFRVGVECLIEPRAGVGHICKRASKLDNGLANVRATLTDHAIDMVQRLICLLPCLTIWANAMGILGGSQADRSADGSLGVSAGDDVLDRRSAYV